MKTENESPSRVRNFSIHHKMTWDAIKSRTVPHFGISQNRRLNWKQFITSYFDPDRLAKHWKSSKFFIKFVFIATKFDWRCLHCIHRSFYTYLISFSLWHVSLSLSLSVYKVWMRRFDFDLRRNIKVHKSNWIHIWIGNLRHFRKLLDITAEINLKLRTHSQRSVATRFKLEACVFECSILSQCRDSKCFWILLI